MTDQQPPAKDPDTSSHPLYEKLVQDGEPLNFAVLVGYFGTPQDEAPLYVRLYTDLGFRRYYRFKGEQARHTERADPRDEYGPTKVFVRMSDKLSDKIELVQQFDSAAFPAGSYLKGAITQRHLDAARAGAAAPERPVNGLRMLASDVSADIGLDDCEVDVGAPSQSCQTGHRCC